MIGAALAAFPASLLMRRAGRRRGFFTGVAFGLVGALVAALAIVTGRFWLLCLGTLLSGVYNAFGQYYRFAAADAAPPAGRARAISYVLAGGLLGGVLGPEISKHTIDLAQPRFLASYLSLVGVRAAGGGPACRGCASPTPPPRRPRERSARCARSPPSRCSWWRPCRPRSATR